MDIRDDQGRTVEQQVYMGALISSPQGDVVLPFLDDEAALEYELAHSIATSSDKDRKITLGIVDTDTFFAGPEFDGRRVPWAYETTMSRLRTQYKIRNIGQDGLSDYVESDGPETDEEGNPVEKKSPKDPPDVLLVPDPSSLTDTATKALVKYMQAGNPTILLADPLPFYWTSRNPTDIGVLNAPRQPRINPRSPYSQVLTSAFLPKADEGRLTQISQALGIQWDNGTAAWGLFNPHPSFRGALFISPTWPEYYGRFEKAFVYAREHSDHQPFNQQDSISSGLKELLFFYPGTVMPAAGANTTFTPLITLAGDDSGATTWDRLTFTPTQVVRGYDPQTGRQTTDEQPPDPAEEAVQPYRKGRSPFRAACRP